MKKILLIVAMTAGVYQLKAQTLISPPDSSLLRSPGVLKEFKPNDNSLQKKFSLPELQNNKSLSALIPAGNTELFACRMPVAKVHSDDHILTVNVHSDDRMPIQKVKVVDPLTKKALITP
jgi:hypothetical protein